MAVFGANRTLSAASAFRAQRPLETAGQCGKLPSARHFRRSVQGRCGESVSHPDSPASPLISGLLAGAGRGRRRRAIAEVAVEQAFDQEDSAYP